MEKSKTKRSILLKEALKSKKNDKTRKTGIDGLSLSNKYFFFVVVFLTILLFPLVSSVSASSNPGDLFFTVKLLIERVSMDENNLDDLIALLEDRSNSYVTIYETGDCLQLLIAEGEYIKSLKGVLNKQKSIDSNQEYDSYLDKIVSSTKLVADTAERQVCSNINQDVLHHWFLVKSEELRFSENIDENDINYINNYYKNLIDQYSKLRDSVRSEVLSDQQTVNTLNELLLSIDNYLMIIDENLQSKRYSDILIRLKTIDKSIQNGNQLLSEDESIYTNWEEEVTTICNSIAGLENCDSHLLEGQWNSIRYSQNIFQSVISGEQLFREYFVNFNHTP